MYQAVGASLIDTGKEVLTREAFALACGKAGIPEKHVPTCVQFMANGKSVTEAVALTRAQMDKEQKSRTMKIVGVVAAAVGVLYLFSRK